MIMEFDKKRPEVDSTAYISEDAKVIGEVKIGKDSSVWFGAVIRGDESEIIIGERSNVQDNAVIHSDHGEPVVIGNDVTIGHNAVIHSCHIHDNVVIGMGAVVLNGAVIEEGSVIAAGSVVKVKTNVPENTLMAGAPAVEKKTFENSIRIKNNKNAAEYVRLAKIYKDC